MLNTVAIKKHNDFIYVYKNGRCSSGKFLLLYTFGVRKNMVGNALGIVASKKTGKSVRRNRLKRLIKENYRNIENYIRLGYNFVFVARPQQDGCMPDYNDIRAEMMYLLSRAGAFDRQKWEQS